MALDKSEYMEDRFSIAVGGHNSGDDPEIIGETQYADSKNVTMRGGRIRSRPRFTKVANLPNDPENEEYFQGGFHFKSKNELVVRASGRMYRMKLESSPPSFEEITQKNVTVWEAPIAQVDTITISAGTNSPGVNTINVKVTAKVAGVQKTDEELSTAVDWATSHAATATALASAINADGDLSSILTADASAGDGTLTLTSDVKGRGFVAVTVDAGDVESSIANTTPNHHMYTPSRAIDQGGTADRPGTPATNDYFYDWDIPMLIQWNGSSWDNVDTTSVTQDIPLDADAFREEVWFEEVAGTLVTQDGHKTPVKYDGTEWTHENDIPVGTAMKFANGRLHVASAGQRRIVTVGDILQNGDADTALSFTETGYLVGGGSFAFPDKVMALHEIPVMDTSTGQGSMIVGTQRNVHALRTEIADRDLWSSVDGFMRPVLPEIGMASQAGVASVNNDLYFRSSRGLRSLRMAVGEQQTPGYGGLNQEMPEKFRKRAIQHNSTIHADDRLLTLVKPIVKGFRWVYEGASVINFDSINRLGQKSPMAFDGYWTLPDDHYFRQLIDIDGVCYAVVLNDSGGTMVDELWRLQTQTDEDTTYEESPTYEFVTRALHAGNPDGRKLLRRLDIWLSGIEGNVAMDVYFRPNRQRDWIHWLGYDSSGTLLANTLSVSRSIPDEYDPTLPDDFVERFTLPDPGSEVYGYSFQLKLTWTGNCRIDLLKPYFQPLAESIYTEHEPSITLT